MSAMSDKDRLVVYISSTAIDLKEYREAIIRAIRKLGHDYMAMEDYRAEGTTALKKCLSDVSESDIYLGIFAWRYGSIPPGQKESITALEYRTAVKSGLPRLIFILDEDFDWKPRYVDRGENAEKIYNLRKELCETNIVEFFTTPDDLATKATVAIAHEVIRLRVQGSVQHKLSVDEAELYQQWALDQYGFIDMVGLGGDGLSFPLDEVYVPLRFMPHHMQVGYGSKTIQSPPSGAMLTNENGIRLESIFGQFYNQRGLLLIGEPGSGKTTVLRQLLCQVLTRGGAYLGLNRQTLPVFVRLGHLDENAFQHPFWNYIQQELNSTALGQFSETIGERLWLRGDLLLLLDGLDEIADREQRARACQYLEAATNGAVARGIRVVITCRTSAFISDALFGGRLRGLELCPLDPPRIQEFIQVWFRNARNALKRANELSLSMIDIDSMADELRELLDSKEYASQRLKSLLSSPLMLALMCVVVLRGNQVPRHYGEFYRECLQTLLGPWSRSKGITPPIAPDDALEILRPLAYFLHSRFRRDDLNGDELKEVIFPEVDRLSRRLRRPLSTKAIIDWLQRGAGVFCEFGKGEYGFSHLSFQEYLTALHIAHDQDVLLANLAQHVDEPWWREVILILLGLPEYNLFESFISIAATWQALRRHQSFFRECLEVAHAPNSQPFISILKDPSAPTDVRAAVLRLFVNRNDPAILETAVMLLDHRDQDIAALAKRVSENASIVRVNGRRRRSKRLSPGEVFFEPQTKIRFLPIPAGEFRMGTDDGAPEEGPSHLVRLSEFWVAETPITNRQMAVFLEATRQREPVFWRERRLSDPDYPIVGVNWREALTFCEWLSSMCGLDCTLPTEAQWEYSSRGTDGRQYPWGNEPPDYSRACYYKDEPRTHPDPVGSHPAGRGPFGCLDQAGNVFEWCLDVWNPDAYGLRVSKVVLDPVVTDGITTMRVLRGGTWWFTVEGLKTTYRWHNPLENRNDDIGFRPVINLRRI